MNVDEIESELADDSKQVRAAVLRGITAAYGSMAADEDEYPGQLLGIIAAVRAAVRPLG